eukprot:TRINITY_DN3006_c0_g1_i2.p1 TRINITY_DN3006_c0_g1~~TRINITY_DN3006_c0_g1_i2.p1  ORF type:complete len:445 (+),score=43.72 TRINITY_DN3006_c0_g1_i2:92-1336(+)
MILARESILLAKWKPIQEAFIKNWKANRHRTWRTIVHLPSLTWPRERRHNTNNFCQLENLELTRVFDAARGGRVIYISPFRLSDYVYDYLIRILTINGIGQVQDRVKILVPENASRLPKGLSCAQLLLYSPDCLRQLKALTKGQYAYISPNQVGDADLKVAMELNLPIYSCLPKIAAILSTKEAGWMIFKRAGLSIGITSGAVYTNDQDVVLKLADLIFTYRGVKRWILKQNVSKIGYGIAWIDVHSLKTRIPQSMIALSSMTKKEIKKKITNELFENIKTYIRYTREDVWRKRGDFMDQKCGVVIEASPNTIIASPSVNITIEPDGAIEITSTHDQIFRKPYLFAGAIFPQCSADPQSLCAMSYRIAEVLYDQGCIGFMSIDFITLEGQNELVPIDLNIGCSQTMASSDYSTS